MANLDSFTTAYIDAALWSSTDDNDDPLDKNYSISDLADETLAKMVADCAKFQEKMGQYITEESRRTSSQYSAEELAGHDFWLTREGHGAGFWDGDWHEPAASKLTEESKTFGEVDLYVGDDGEIYS